MKSKGTTCIYVLIAAAISLAVVGCVSSAVKSTRVPATPPLYPPAVPPFAAKPWAKPQVGVPYFLPKVELQLTAILTNVLDSNHMITNYTVTSVVSNYSSWITNYYYTNTGPAANPLQLITNTVMQSMSNYVVSLTLIPSTNQVYTLSVTPIIEQDPDGLYALDIVKDKLKISSDDFTFQVDTNGFINSLNATNADQTPQIIENLAQAVVEIALAPGLPAGTMQAMDYALTISQSLPFWPASPRAPLPELMHPGRVDVVFDPTTQDGVLAANTNLTKMFVRHAAPGSPEALEICPILIGCTFKGKTPPAVPDDYLENYGDKNQGVVFRPLLPYVLSVTNLLGQSGTNLLQYIVMSPNRAPMFSLSVERATFVTRTTSMSFNSGFLNNVSYSNPSQTAAVLKLPLTIVGDIFSSITNVLQLRLNIATAQANIATQQNNLKSQTTNGH